MTRETKVYLNTIEDLTKALSDGKIVYEDYRNGTKREYKMMNNIIVEKHEDDDAYFYVNYGFGFNPNIYYIKEQAPIKIEVGKFYKTRDGHKAICIGSQAYEDDDSVYKMYFGVIGQTETFWTNINGNFYNYKRQYCYDIVDYWEE